MKQEAAGSGKRHDVRSIIASSPRSYLNPPSHIERGRYEEAQKGRTSSVVSTASPITRSSPLTLGSDQGGKAHHSPVGYEDKGGLRNPYPGPSHRASPLSREASQRQHEGAYVARVMPSFALLNLKRFQQTTFALSSCRFHSRFQQKSPAGT